MKKIFGTMLLFSVAAACSPISQQARQDLASPIYCPTAEGDIRVLRSEKAHVMSQIASGVTAVVPAGAVLGVWPPALKQPSSRWLRANTTER